MALKVGINGFGRIGRAFFRYAFEKKDIEVVAVNDLTDAKPLAYLLSRDTVYGKAPFEVTATEDGFIAGGRHIAVLREKDPKEIPWKKHGVETVIESTGFFDTYDKASAHLTGGAKHVVISAPAKDDVGPGAGATVLAGINEEKLKTCTVSSNGSCTTNAGAPLMAILDDAFGIEHALLTTTHAYTASQSLVDGITKAHNLREYRAGAMNLVPTSTGAAIAVTKALTQLDKKFDGVAIRAPVVCGSIVDITCVLKQDTTAEAVNEALRRAAEDVRWSGVFTVTDEPLVSSDIVGMPYGAIADLSLTRVVGGTLVKVCAWYDNEMGYVATLYRHVIGTQS